MHYNQPEMTNDFSLLVPLSKLDGLELLMIPNRLKQKEVHTFSLEGGSTSPLHADVV